MRLFHFSDDAGISRFLPRPPARPAPRRPGDEWLNGPLVWAIDDRHQALYMFPRECPRLLVWPAATTTSEDRAIWQAACPGRMPAYIEADWLERMSNVPVYRYEMPAADFETLDDAGMWICRRPVTPTGVTRIDDLPGALVSQGVTLKPLASLVPLSTLWNSSLHVSGIRLRNARDWQGAAGDCAASWSLP